MSDEPWWWREALCPEIGFDAFFRDGNKDIARQACRLCPVRQECLTEALISRDEYGIFGGFGRDERRRLVRRVEEGQSPELVAQLAIAQERRGNAQDRRRWALGRGAGGHLHADSA